MTKHFIDACLIHSLSHCVPPSSLISFNRLDGIAILITVVAVVVVVNDRVRPLQSANKFGGSHVIHRAYTAVLNTPEHVTPLGI